MQLESASQEQSLNMGNSQNEDDIQGSDYLNGGVSNQFLPEVGAEDQEYDDQHPQDEMIDDDDADDPIDIDNPEDLARRGLKRIFAEDDEENE